MRHGTTSGFSAHQRAGERPCDACCRAKAEYDKRWRAASERVRLNRLHARAQNKAEMELAHRHRDEYQALYAEWLARFTFESEQ